VQHPSGVGDGEIADAGLEQDLGAGDAGATSITEEMKLAAATAIADVVGDEVRTDYIVPSPLDRRVVTAVAEAVAACARREGVTR
jgi:malate dehydrogenase (oxaloacetate-decarboxylating)